MVRIAPAQTIQEMIAEYDKTNDVNQRVSLLIKLGLNYQNLRVYRKALECYRESLRLYENEAFFTEKVFILKNAALCHEELHEYDKAYKLWKEILVEKQERKENREIIIALEKLVGLSVQNNKYHEAIRYSHQLLPEYDKINNIAGIATVYNNLGAYYKKTGDQVRSQEYFNKCRTLINRPNSGINENELANLFLNIGMMHTVLGEMEQADAYMTKALHIRQRQRKDVEMANILNFMAATDLIMGDYKTAQQKIERGLLLVENAKDEPRADEVQIAGYGIYCELLLRKKKIKEFKKYNDLYNHAKDRLIAKEQKQNMIVLEQQLEIEKMEGEIRMIQAEKEKKDAFYRQAELENEKREKELIIHLKELELLRQARDLQQTKIINQELDKQRIAQLMEIAGQKSASLMQQREIELLEKTRALQLLTIDKQSRENKILEMEKKGKEEKLADESKIRRATMGVLLLLLVVVAGTFWVMGQQRKNNRKLGAQNEIISRSNQKIVQQNEELYKVNNELSVANTELSQLNEELYINRENLKSQNNELSNAKKIIARQNKELIVYNTNLENMVNKRTEELIKINKKLTANNSQLEQFGYVVSHNLRGPIARLLGLASLVNKKSLNDENNMLLDKIVEVSKDLDLIIHDLNQVLQVQKGIGQELTVVGFDSKVRKSIQRLENKIEEKNAQITFDFEKAPEVKVVKPYFDSIIYNLLSNAIKYSKPGVKPEINISTEDSGDYILMKIADNGIGIDTVRYKEKLFGLYKRFHTHVDGKGLGLYMVKTQLEAMGGKIELVSAPNEGSVFNVYFKK
jgi:signal transduction histidine kinase